MRTRLPLLVLAASVALSGCELLVRFDPGRLDGSADAMGADRGPTDATDMTPPMDVTDVPVTMDVVDVVDASDTGTEDAADTVIVDAPDVVETDVVDVPAVDVPVVDVPVVDVVDVPVVDVPVVDVPVVDVVDAGTDEGPDVVDAAVDDVPTDTGPSFIPLNGCTYATATDLTADSTPTITFPGAAFTYTPPCVRIRAGQMVTFSADSGSSFASHPLMPGDGTTGTTQAGTPIVPTSTGTTVSFTFPDPGTWGYYCQFHASFGMFGAVYVDP